MPIKNTAYNQFKVKIYDPSLVNIYKSQIGQGTSIGAFTEIGGAKIGENCKIQARVFIPPGTRIGNSVFIGPGVTFCNVKYPDPLVPTDPDCYRGALVMDGACIGANATILPGCIIGKRAFIGAGSVLTGNARPYGIYIGNPARYDSKVYNKAWPMEDAEWIDPKDKFLKECFGGTGE
ncbi:MAG: N-acetyltransferase [Actinomycetia bacterium]|nr:N-acetyltransferase [Actinomycetes bacterium]